MIAPPCLRACEANRIDELLATNRIDELLATLAPDAELVSPFSARTVFRGHDDLRIC